MVTPQRSHLNDCCSIEETLLIIFNIHRPFLAIGRSLRQSTQNQERISTHQWEGNNEEPEKKVT